MGGAVRLTLGHSGAAAGADLAAQPLPSRLCPSQHEPVPPSRELRFWKAAHVVQFLRTRGKP